MNLKAVVNKEGALRVKQNYLYLRHLGRFLIDFLKVVEESQYAPLLVLHQFALVCQPLLYFTTTTPKVALTTNAFVPGWIVYPYQWF